MRHRIKKSTIRIAAFLLSAICLVHIAGALLIGVAVKNYSRMAKEQFPGDRVEALIALVECESCRTVSRNDAVWTLGQLGDPRALPVLEENFTANKRDRLDEDVLQIAIRHIRRGDINWTEAFLWRWMLPERD